MENDAVKVLSLEESLAVRKRLAKAGELDRIFTPRFVCADKNDDVRTDSCPLPPEPSARLVVPGFKDRANLDGQIRRDAPTRSTFEPAFAFEYDRLGGSRLEPSIL